MGFGKGHRWIRPKTNATTTKKPKHPRPGRPKKEINEQQEHDQNQPEVEKPRSNMGRPRKDQNKQQQTAKKSSPGSVPPRSLRTKGFTLVQVETNRSSKTDPDPGSLQLKPKSRKGERKIELLPEITSLTQSTQATNFDFDTFHRIVEGNTFSLLNISEYSNTVELQNRSMDFEEHSSNLFDHEISADNDAESIRPLGKVRRRLSSSCESSLQSPLSQPKAKNAAVNRKLSQITDFIKPLVPDVNNSNEGEPDVVEAVNIESIPHVNAHNTQNTQGSVYSVANASESIIVIVDSNNEAEQFLEFEMPETSWPEKPAELNNIPEANENEIAISRPRIPTARFITSTQKETGITPEIFSLTQSQSCSDNVVKPTPENISCSEQSSNSPSQANPLPQNETSSIVAENPQEGAAKSNDPENIVPNANDTTLDNITVLNPLSDKVVVAQNPMIMEVQDHNYNLAEDNQSRIGLETNIEIPVPVAKSSLKRSQSDDSDTDSSLCKKIKVEPNTQNTYSDDSDVIFVQNTQHQPIDLEYSQDSFQRHVQEEEALDPFYGYGRQKSASVRAEIELEESLTEQEIENDISELPVNQIDESDSEPEVGMEMHDESESFLDMSVEKEIELEADGFSQLDDIRQPSSSHDPVPLAIPKPLPKVSKKTKERTRALYKFVQRHKKQNTDPGTKPKIDRPRPCPTLSNWKGNPQKIGNVIEDASMISTPSPRQNIFRIPVN